MVKEEVRVAMVVALKPPEREGNLDLPCPVLGLLLYR